MDKLDKAIRRICDNWPSEPCWIFTSPDGSTVYRSMRTDVCPEEFKNAYAGYITGFPDSEFLIVNLFGDGDQLIKHWNFKGTHAESGKKVNVYGATLVKMKDGKIFQEQDYWDARKFYKQLAE